MLERLPRSLLALLISLGLLVAACGGSESSDDEGSGTDDDRTEQTESTDAPAESTYQVATATTADAVPVYSEAGADEPAETIANATSYGLSRVFLVAENEGDWLNVWLPKKPNGSKGWVKASDVKLETTDYKLVVDVPNFTITLYEGDEATLQFPIGTAQASYPTPPGTYFITDLLEPPDPDTAYGTFAYGLSGYSEVAELQNFNGGDGQLGIHGTNKPSSIGSEESHGCIRLNNEDIEQLVPLLPLGTPVEIIAEPTES